MPRRGIVIGVAIAVFALILIVAFARIDVESSVAGPLGPVLANNGGELVVPALITGTLENPK